MLKMSFDKNVNTEDDKVIDTQTCSFTWSCKGNELVKLFTFPKSSRFKIIAMFYCNDMNFNVNLVSPLQLKGYMKGSIKLLSGLDEEIDLSEAEGNFDAKSGIVFQNKEWMQGHGVPYDNYKLLCEFSISQDEFLEYKRNNNVSVTENSLKLSDSTTLNVALKDFLTMYADKNMTDLTLQCDGKTLYAHKFVLTARSPVFSSMFAHDMIEEQSNTVKISDIDFETLHYLLMFMYGGVIVNLNYKKATALLIAADKYIIPSLKNICSAFLRNMVQKHNVCELVLLSDAVQDESLKSKCITYITADIKNILISPEWKQLQESNMKLSTEILAQYALES